MKKIIALLLALLFSVFLTACGNKESGNENSGDLKNANVEKAWFPKTATATLPNGNRYQIIRCEFSDEGLYYHYDMSGTTDREAYYSYSYKQSDGMLQQIRQEYSYGFDVYGYDYNFQYNTAEGQIVLTETDQDGETSTETTVYTFDSENRVSTKTVTVRYDDEVSETVYVYTYGEDRFTVSYDIKHKVYRSDGSSEVRHISRCVATLPYDFSSMVVEITYLDGEENPEPRQESYINANGERISGMMTRTKKVFNAFGYCTEVTNFFEDGGSGYLSDDGYDMPTFDSEGRILSNVHSTADGPSATSAFRYDSNGNMTEFSLETEEGKATVEIEWMEIPAEYVKAIESYVGEKNFALSELIEEGIPAGSESMASF